LQNGLNAQKRSDRFAQRISLLSYIFQKVQTIITIEENGPLIISPVVDVIDAPVNELHDDNTPLLKLSIGGRLQ
jgi:hypothetical protein